MTAAELARLDALLKAPKRFFGPTPGWITPDKDGAVALLQGALLANESTEDGLILHGRASRIASSPWMQIILTIGRRPIERLSYSPMKGHRNHNSEHCPAHLRFLTFPRGGSRYYAWFNNRVEVVPARSEVAEPLPAEVTTQVQAIAYMFERIGLTGSIAPPPSQQVLV